MVIFDIATSFITGAAIGIRAQGERRDLALLAGGLGMGVPGLFFLERYRDWDWQYIFDPTTLPYGVPALFVMFVLLASVAGHYVGSRQPKVLPVSLVLFVIYVACFWHQTLYVGSYAEYHAGSAQFLPAGFLWDLALLGPPGAIVLALCWLRAAPQQ
jgi:hypothetical protein